VSTKILLAFIHEEDRARAAEEIKVATSTLKSGSSEFHFKTKSGKEKFGFIQWKFEFDSNCQSIRIYGILKDNTEVKLAELEREKMISEIIQHSKKLEQFAYIVSHNLRGPIANILGLSSVLKGKTSEAEKQLIQQYIFTAVGQLDEVVKDLNKILQIKSQITETKENVLLKNLVEDIRFSIQNLIEKEDVQIYFDFSMVGQIKTIKSYLYSIFYNLISNSIKYKHAQKPPIIRINSRMENGKIRISFKDNGSGIDLNLQKDKIFGLYKRFHENIEGKGFGLFMVKTQIEALGGNITVKSELGEGTEFIILLPV
jgi:signal transduction histidine kinase